MDITLDQQLQKSGFDNRIDRRTEDRDRQKELIYLIESRVNQINRVTSIIKPTVTRLMRIVSSPEEKIKNEERKMDCLFDMQITDEKKETALKEIIRRLLGDDGCQEVDFDYHFFGINIQENGCEDKLTRIAYSLEDLLKTMGFENNEITANSDERKINIIRNNSKISIPEDKKTEYFRQWENDITRFYNEPFTKHIFNNVLLDIKNNKFTEYKKSPKENNHKIRISTDFFNTDINNIEEIGKLSDVDMERLTAYLFAAKQEGYIYEFTLTGEAILCKLIKLEK